MNAEATIKALEEQLKKAKAEARKGKDSTRKPKVVKTRVYDNNDLNIIEYHKPVYKNGFWTGEVEPESKSILLYGDGTFPYKDKLKEMGASFGRKFIVDGEYRTGWCINNKEHKHTVESLKFDLGIGIF